MTSFENVIIRRFVPSDEDFIVSMTHGKYAEALEEYPRKRIKTAEIDGKVVGWSYVGGGSRVYPAFVFVFVHSEFRGRGIGSALYRDAEHQARKTGAGEIFSTFYCNETRAFTLKMDFSYTTSDVFMEYSGGFTAENGSTVRQYRDEDYYRFDEIWSGQIYEMRKRIGLPVSSPAEPNEEYRKQYCENSGDYFVSEDESGIVCVGGVSGDCISCLAVDAEKCGRGYGSAMAAFLTNEILRRGYSAAHLSCETGNDNAFLLYSKLGYRVLYRTITAVKKL